MKPSARVTPITTVGDSEEFAFTLSVKDKDIVKRYAADLKADAIKSRNKLISMLKDNDYAVLC